MPRKPDEDLFRESTMTFGEHLEELRSCLFKALLWLVGGFLVGLLVARPVVSFIQGPLIRALSAHYKGSAIQTLERLQRQGLPLPGSVEQLADLVARGNLLPEEVFLEPSELLQQLRGVYTSIGQQRTQAIKLLQDVAPLLERMQVPAGNPRASDSSGNLSGETREQLLKAVRLIQPADPQAQAAKQGLTEEDLDRIITAIEHRQAVAEDDRARLLRAIKFEEERFRQDLARTAKAVALLEDTELPSRGRHTMLSRDDLGRVFLWRPVENDRRIQTRALGAPEAFTIYVKAALLVGVLIASPGIFYHVWSFVAAGLYHHERHFVHVFGPFSLGLFFGGAALAFLVVFRLVLGFLFSFNRVLGIGIEPRITEWLGFALVLPLGFGIAFQLPLVMLFLERIGVFDVQAYLSKWRIAILVIAVLSMLLTPPDPGSMLLMGIPLSALYFGGILLCRFMPRSRSPYEDEEKEEKEEKEKKD